jgi:hypothetical protein
MYEALGGEDEISQGDIVDDCIFYTLDISSHPYDPDMPPSAGVSARWS